jgi:membrane-bound serine protease (ClpP class)
MTFQIEMLLILIATGIILLIAEIYLPGAIAGIFGGISLFAAVLYGFGSFGPATGMFIAVGIAVMTCVMAILWLKYFPRTSMGRKITLEQDMSDASAANPEWQRLIGKEGEATSELRPAGFATFDKKRVDVVTQGEMIAKGERVRVIDVKGNRVIVAITKKV